MGCDSVSYGMRKDPIGTREDYCWDTENNLDDRGTKGRFVTQVLGHKRENLDIREPTYRGGVVIFISRHHFLVPRPPHPLPGAVQTPMASGHSPRCVSVNIHHYFKPNFRYNYPIMNFRG